jgi:hypothetical protein
VPGVADGLQLVAVPAFEQQDLPVDARQGTGGHEQIAQVRGGSPARQVMQRLVGQRDVPAGQAAQVLTDLGIVAEPGPAAVRLRHRHQVGEQAAEPRVHLPGSVIEQPA